MAQIDQAKLVALSEAGGEPEWFLERRLRAARAFVSMPDDPVKYGIGVFSAGRLLDQATMLGGSSDFAGAGAGVSEAALDDSRTSVKVVGFADAWKYPALAGVLDEWLYRVLDVEGERFGVVGGRLGAYHLAMMMSGVLVEVPEGVSAEQAVDLFARRADYGSMQHVLVVARRGSSVRVVDWGGSQDTVVDEGGHVSTHGVEVVVEEGASVEYVSVHHEAESVNMFGVRRARVEKDASMKWVDAYVGGGVVKSVSGTDLVASGARADTAKLYFGRGEQRFDLYQEIVHEAPHTESGMVARGVLDDKAKAVVRGLIRIEKGASSSVGEQNEDVLLLSETAEVDPVPALEILNNDVQCAHGSSTSTIDEEKVFYLMSRGVDRYEAMRAVVSGFLEPVIVGIGEGDVAEYVRKAVGERLVLDVK